MKKLFIISIVVMTLSCYSHYIVLAKSAPWEKVKVNKVIDNENLLLFDGRVVKIIGITSPSITNYEDSKHCFSRPIYRKLKLLLENKNIKIQQDETRKNKSGVLPRHIKIDKQNLAEFMLSQGMAIFKSDNLNTKYDKKYLKVSKIAKDAQIGIYQECANNKNRTELKQYVHKRNFKKKYGQFLAPISVGRVKEVLSGQSFRLDNGLKVKLLGIETPLPTDSRKGFGCFGKKSQEYLESLILGKRVFLTKDISQLSERRELVRNVYLPKNGKKGIPEVFINQKMIEDGFARSFWPTEDEKHKDNFENLQQEIYKNPQGAWNICLREILGK